MQGIKKYQQNPETKAGKSLLNYYLLVFNQKIFN
jgi:hypothetical protein